MVQEKQSISIERSLSAIFDAIRIDGAGETEYAHCREEPETIELVQLAYSAGWGWPGHSAGHCSRHVRTVFFLSQQQYFSVLPNRPDVTTGGSLHRWCASIDLSQEQKNS